MTESLKKAMKRNVETVAVHINRLKWLETLKKHLESQKNSEPTFEPTPYKMKKWRNGMKRTAEQIAFYEKETSETLQLNIPKHQVEDMKKILKERGLLHA